MCFLCEYQNFLLAFVLAESRPAEFADKVLADASKSAFEVEHDDIAFIPSSSAWIEYSDDSHELKVRKVKVTRLQSEESESDLFEKWK